MKTAERRNRILIVYALLILGAFAYARLPVRAVVTSSAREIFEQFKSRPHGNHEPAGTISPLSRS